MFKYMTGIKPTGEFHLGNYISTILPTLDRKQETLYLIADLHALASDTYKDIYKNVEHLIRVLHSFEIYNIFIQSQIQQITWLNWILLNFTAKGILNRAHAYKVLSEENLEKEKDQDKGIFAGLYTYPVLMSADLTIFDCDYVFIGPDQVQHIEMAKEIINKFNYVYKEDILKVPSPIICENSLLGYDGRKMSKSYNNTIPLMCSEKKLKKYIFSIKTNSKNIGERKEWNESPITTVYESFADKEQCAELKYNMLKGISWRDVKDETFNVVNDKIKLARKRYFDYKSSDYRVYIDFDIMKMEELVDEKILKIKKKIGFY